MFFRVLAKDGLEELVAGLSADYEVIGPVRKTSDSWVFAPIERPGDLALDFGATLLPPKKWFFPAEEPLMTFRVEGSEVLDDSVEAPDRVLFGLHPCDVNGLLLMDNVFSGAYEDPYYRARRDKTLIVGVSCKEAQSGCTCNAWGTDESHWGFDLFLTDLGDVYFVSVGTVKGAELLDRNVETRDVTVDDVTRFQEAMHRFKESFAEELDTEQLPLLLDAKFDSPIWDELGARCLSCGACSMVCPTCYCFDVEDRLDADGTTGTRVRVWDSCQFKEFAEVAHGHNFREARASRVKYRYYHKQWGYLSKFERVLCVGCGRCARACKAGINPTVVVKALQEGVVR